MDKMKAKKRILSGTVVRDKMDKTIVVRVDRTKVHPLYHRRYHVSKTYHVHDPEKSFHVGDRVEIQETRPLSRTIRWQVIKK